MFKNIFNNYFQIIFWVLILNIIYIFNIPISYSKAAKPPSQNQKASVSDADNVNASLSEFGDDGEAATDSGTAQSTPSIPDPLETFNRFSFNLTMWIDSNIVSYIDTAYRIVVPPPVRIGVSNAIINTHEPINSANDFLQLRYKSGFRSVVRFLINSTLGFFGAFDAAAKLGIYNEPNDFGYTLAYYHVGEGFYLFIPFLGPSTLKNGLSAIGESYFFSSLVEKKLDISQLQYTSFKISTEFLMYLNKREVLNSIANGSSDKYSLLKYAYIQSRSFNLQHFKATR